MKNIKLGFKPLLTKSQPFIKKLDRYGVFIFVIIVLLVYSLLVFRINTLVNSEPPEEVVAEKLQTSGRPKIDQTAVEKIQQLQDNSVEVQTLFKQARENPFQE